MKSWDRLKAEKRRLHQSLKTVRAIHAARTERWKADVAAWYAGKQKQPELLK